MEAKNGISEGVSTKSVQKMICNGTYGSPGTTYTTEQREEACAKYDQMNSGKTESLSAVSIALIVLAVAIAAWVSFYIYRLLHKSK